MSRLIGAIPGSPEGPGSVAKAVGIDKVLASRVLKAGSSKDPVAALQMMPGPEPLRRLARAAARRGVAPEVLVEFEEAVERFRALIRAEGGDRSGFDAILSAWLPEARAEFELRRKQAAFRAISQLRGTQADTSLSTVFLHPSEDGERLDVVWIFGLLGLQRLRPGAPVKFASRRVNREGTARRPCTLARVSVEGLDGLRLDEFCSVPPPTLGAHRVRDVVHYTLEDDGFGPRSAVDLVFAEVNFSELPLRSPAGRRRHVFAEVSNPSKLMVFDVLVHDALPESAPDLYVYDTAFEGVADPNDPSRDADHLGLCESIQPLGCGISKFRVAEVPRYLELLRLACARLGWDPERFRGHRCRIDYPVYGTQVTVAFPAEPGS